MLKWRYIQLCAEIELIEKRLEVLDPSNVFEAKEINQHLLSLKRIDCELHIDKIKNRSKKLALIYSKSPDSL